MTTNSNNSEPIYFHYRLMIARQLGEALNEIPDLRTRIQTELHCSTDEVNALFWGTADLCLSKIAKLEAIVGKVLLLTPTEVCNFEKITNKQVVFNPSDYQADLYKYLKIIP